MRSRTGGRILLQELYRIADGKDGLGGIIRNLAAELFLESHYQFDGVEAVGSKVVDEAGVLGDLIGLDSEMLHHDLFYALRDITHVRLTVPCSSQYLKPRMSLPSCRLMAQHTPER